MTFNSPKKIAFFLPSLHGGGAEKTMLNLATGIAERGYNVDLVLVQAAGQYLNLVPKSVNLIDLNVSRTIKCLPALIHYLRLELPEYMLSAMHVNTVALIARLLSGVSTKVIVSERNTISLLIQNEPDLRWKFTLKLVQKLYPLADCIVAVSKGVADDLSRSANISRNRIKVIYNPVITPQLREKVNATAFDQWFQENTPPVILAVGSLTAQKDFSSLIDAFSIVRRSYSVRLLILGEGEKRNELEQQIERLNLKLDIRLPGYISNPYPYILRSKVFVLSSRWEGLPGVLIEALYCGTPIVATDCQSGPREILGDNRYGKLVPVGDIDKLAQAIEDALNDKILRPTHESWKPFELDTVVDQYINTLLMI